MPAFHTVNQRCMFQNLKAQVRQIKTCVPYHIGDTHDQRRVLQMLMALSTGAHC